MYGIDMEIVATTLQSVWLVIVTANLEICISIWVWTTLFLQI